MLCSAVSEPSLLLRISSVKNSGGKRQFADDDDDDDDDKEKDLTRNNAALEGATLPKTLHRWGG